MDTIKLNICGHKKQRSKNDLNLFGNFEKFKYKFGKIKIPSTENCTVKNTYYKVYIILYIKKYFKIFNISGNTLYRSLH